MIVNWSMDEYIDYYYETAMEAEREYNDFIEVAVELYKELEKPDNIVWKRYDKLLSWSRTLRSSVGRELCKQFEQWDSELRLNVSKQLKSNGLCEIDTPDCWEILPFTENGWTLTYDGKFETLVNILTQQSHGALFDDVDNIPDVHDYYEKGELTYEEIIQVFYRGWQNVQLIRENKLSVMKDFCEQLREDVKELELRMKQAEREFYLED